MAPAIGQFAVNFIVQHDHIGARSTSAMARKSLSSRIAPKYGVGIWESTSRLGACPVSAAAICCAAVTGSRFSPVVTSSFTPHRCRPGPAARSAHKRGRGHSARFVPDPHQAADGQISGSLPPTVTRISSVARRSAEQSARQDSSQSLRAALAVRDVRIFCMPFQQREAAPLSECARRDKIRLAQPQGNGSGISLIIPKNS